ncbi:alpha/beta fold hydrolase [Gilvimarinus agarilyticus]|uniref:alpha/beta fold hydrolase n=1 Tax=Gilvimarinus agarilyticus TaxID=679259 RepID=UPI000698674B|nr:alpha/beta hydrolase [Gilvimarinus agarilyticus]
MHCATLLIWAFVLLSGLSNLAQARVLEKLSDTSVQTPPVIPSLTAIANAGYVHEPIFNSRIYLVEAGVQHKDTVILVHGLGQNGYRDWRGVIPALAQHYHVLAMDLPGFGLSQKPEGRYSPSQYARLLQWLISQTGQQRVFLVGHSLGGAVALRYAASFPDTLDRLVVVSVAGVLQRSAFLAHSSALPVSSGALPLTDQIPQSFKDIAGEQLRDWGKQLLSFAERLPDPIKLLRASDTAWSVLLGDQPNANAALALMGEDFTLALGQISTPTLIVWGDQDPVAPPRTGVLLEGQLRHAERVVLSQTGHVPMAHRDTFNPLLLEFLASTRVPEQSKPLSLSQGQLVCHEQKNQYFSGVFSEIELHNCDGAVLENVQAQSIYIDRSEVELRNVNVLSHKVALQVNQSQITMTNGQLIGAYGILADNSELDLAGVTVRGTEAAMSASGPSSFIFSVSKLRGPGLSRTLHGVYEIGASKD